MSDDRPFTFSELHSRTPDLDGPLRMAVFYELPAEMQREAWDNLAAEMDYRSSRDFEELDDGR